MKERNWIDDMLDEMEAAWVMAEQTSLRTERREAVVKLIVRKHFHPGMPKVEAFRLLGELKANGFEIGECRHEGARNWPDGKLKEYPDPQTRQKLQRQILSGFSRITAVKKYGVASLANLRGGGITMMVGDRMEGIVSVKGVVWVNLPGGEEY